MTVIPRHATFLNFIGFVHKEQKGQGKAKFYFDGWKMSLS